MASRVSWVSSRRYLARDAWVWAAFHGHSARSRRITATNSTRESPDAGSPADVALDPTGSAAAVGLGERVGVGDVGIGRETGLRRLADGDRQVGVDRGEGAVDQLHAVARVDL